MRVEQLADLRLPCTRLFCCLVAFHLVMLCHGRLEITFRPWLTLPCLAPVCLDPCLFHPLQAATSAPLIERSIERATGIVYNITGGKDLTLQVRAILESACMFGIGVARAVLRFGGLQCRVRGIFKKAELVCLTGRCCYYCSLT
jgi:hypothetical protein